MVALLAFILATGESCKYLFTEAQNCSMFSSRLYRHHESQRNPESHIVRMSLWKDWGSESSCGTSLKGNPRSLYKGWQATEQRKQDDVGSRGSIPQLLDFPVQQRSRDPWEAGTRKEDSWPGGRSRSRSGFWHILDVREGHKSEGLG